MPCGVAKKLASILQLLVGRSKHHVQNTQNFIESIKDLKLEPGECIMSYDITALFTSMPVKQSPYHNPQQISKGPGTYT